MAYKRRLVSKAAEAGSESTALGLYDRKHASVRASDSPTLTPASSSLGYVPWSKDITKARMASGVGI